MSKESDKKDAAQAEADAAQDKADAAAFAADEDVTLPKPLPPSKSTGKFDLACCTNALNNVLNLRGTSDRDAICAEFEAQLTTILDASSVAPDAWNKVVTNDQQESGQTFVGHPK